MKIESTIKDNFFKIYNESRGVVQNKSKIIKNKSSKCLDYLTSVFLTNILIMLIAIFLLYTNIFFVSLILSGICIIYLLVVFLRMYYSYLFRKQNNFKNIIEVTEEGLIDRSLSNIKITIVWDKVKGIVIKKYSITVLTDTKIYFFFDIKSKTKFLKVIKPYIKSNLIIN